MEKENIEIIKLLLSQKGIIANKKDDILFFIFQSNFHLNFNGFIKDSFEECR